MWESQIIPGLRLINPMFPHSAVSDNQILGASSGCQKNFTKNIIKGGSNILTTPHQNSLPFPAFPHTLQHLLTSQHLLEKTYPALATTYFSSSPIFSFSALYYVEALGTSPRRRVHILQKKGGGNLDWRFENYLWQAGELLKFMYKSMLVILVLLHWILNKC